VPEDGFGLHLAIGAQADEGEVGRLAAAQIAERAAPQQRGFKRELRRKQRVRLHPGR
jgi:hypothetical protein